MLQLAVFHRGEIVPLIPISVKPFSLPVTATESSARTLVLTTSLLQARSNPRSRKIARRAAIAPLSSGALFPLFRFRRLLVLMTCPAMPGQQLRYQYPFFRFPSESDRPWMA